MAHICCSGCLLIYKDVFLHIYFTICLIQMWVHNFCLNMIDVFFKVKHDENIHDISTKRRLKSACASFQSNQRLRCPLKIGYPRYTQWRVWSDFANAFYLYGRSKETLKICSYRNPSVALFSFLTHAWFSIPSNSNWWTRWARGSLEERIWKGLQTNKW